MSEIVEVYISGLPQSMYGRCIVAETPRGPLTGANESDQSSFVQGFSENLSGCGAPEVVDVHTTRCVFHVAPVIGRGHPAVRLRNAHRNSGPISLLFC